ncbi:MAG: septal ring lytic transglycosylase RlpA family protein [Gemmatimonadales bacterium]|nr:MAG: septal ring lytic transglycosylase RlpA family protein [Gemmatimonadales bacterium]
MSVPPSHRRPPALRSLVLLLGMAALAGCRTLGPPLPPEPPPAEGWSEEGIASWYGHPFHGRTTASGERYDMEAMTAAHQTLPFGTVLHVRNLENGLSTRVRINDRGPFVGGRILDLSRRAAREIDMIGPGTAPVRITVVESPAPVRCWHVQTGAFRDADNAHRREDQLRGLGWPVATVRGSDGVSRVFVGPYETRQEGDRAAERLDGLLMAC